MRFTIARLCGGEALMAVPADILDLDLEHAREVLEADGGDIRQADGMMLVFGWNGMEVTLYSQGKVMFFPLDDRQLCIRYASEILRSLE